MEPGAKGGKTDGEEARQRDDNPEDCPVCLNFFDDIVQRPRTLPCGHTFCTVCINAIKEQNQVTCPTCRTVHAVPESGNFPISFALEAFIKMLRNTSMASSSSPCSAGKGIGHAGTPNQKGAGNSRTPGQKGAAGLSRSVEFLLQEQEAKVLDAITACQVVQSQLDNYQTTLVDWHDQQQQLEDKLQAMIDDSINARVLMRQEESQMVAKKEEVQQREQQLHAVLEALRKVNKEHEAGVIVVDVVRCTDEAEQRVEECWEMFPDVHTATTARKVREASRASVEAFKSVHAALETSRVPPGVGESECNLAAAGLSIMDKLQALQCTPLWAEDLRSMKESARTLLKVGHVFATHRVEGQNRYARITLEDDQVYLHCLQDQPPPPGASILQVDELVPAASRCLVFLDLALPDSEPQRVLIRLSLDTPMGRQFVLLCIGQRGPSYLNTRLWRVINKGRPGECVCGGDYERNDGTGGAALLPDFDEGEYWRSGRAGAVWGWMHRGPSVGALFGIVTRDRQDKTEPGGVFAELVKGLEAVVAIAEHEDIKKVTVVNCGVVLREL